MMPRTEANNPMKGATEAVAANQLMFLSGSALDDAREALAEDIDGLERR
jgi:hypothetical protein